MKPGKRGCGAAATVLVVIGVECHDGGPGRARVQHITSASADVLRECVLDNVARGSAVHTDVWKGYNDTGRYRFNHVVTNLSESDDPAHGVMPEAYRVAGLLKRRRLDTHGGA